MTKTIITINERISRPMYIERISVRNFRLLQNVDISLEERTTVIVGRNNSGKTSLAELFRRLLTENPTFGLEDFSLSTYEQFWDAYHIFASTGDQGLAREKLPTIEVTIIVSYRDNPTNLSLLSEFIIDLDPDCTEAHIKMCYQTGEEELNHLFDNLDELIKFEEENEKEQKQKFYRILKERLPKSYKMFLYALDPNDPTNRKMLEWKNVRKLFQGSFINAQRELGDMTSRERDVLGKILESMFKSAMSDTANPADRNIAENLRVAVQNIEGAINNDFNKHLFQLMPAIAMFGYPGLKDPRFFIETILDVESLLKDFTKVRYQGVYGVNLPESYNGLGARNLIYILFKLFEFYKEYVSKNPAPISHLIFIEEPESHLHPQMQEVFISKLNELARDLPKKFNGEPWPVQIVVTTHSSHIANKADFTAIRYFMTSTNHGFLSTKVKDLKVGASSLGDDIDFLHRYMTLTQCDLFFADKAILIEGPTERILLPKMIEKFDKDYPDVNLGSQYISVMEVGGAFAHKFFKLIDFLELKTLIITDLDTIDSKNNNKACVVSMGDRTSNACIKEWFNNDHITPHELLKKADDEKTRGFCRLAYQIPENNNSNSSCGRSFEDAFMLANLNLFGLHGSSREELEKLAWKKAQNVKKTEFALNYALVDTQWRIPRYIFEGLLWLGSTDRHADGTTTNYEWESFQEIAAGEEG